MNDTDDGATSDRQIKQFCRERWTRFIGYAKRKMNERRTKKQQETSADKASRITATATAWIAFFTLVSVLVNGGMFYVLKQQLKEMHDAGTDTHNLAVAAGVQADAARVAANAAKSAAETASAAMKQSEETFITEQRPYLVAAIPDFNQTSIVGNQAITANITFVNIGRTPARKIIRNIKMSPYHASDRKAFIRFINGLFANLRDKDRKDRSEIAITQDAEVDVAPQANQFSTNSAITIPPEDVTALAVEKGQDVGKVALFYVGVASYTDAFGTPYKTEFCYFYVGTNLKVWHVCDNHNTIQ